jgi:1-acyl-sn-glycerol-3-phosphate acyltransferase
VSGQNQFGLLGQSRFAPFFITQFLGALNDNIFRNGLVILVTFQGVLVAGMNVSELANVAGALFILPFFLFSATAGQLADKYEKSMLMRRIKLLEIMLMIMAGIAFVSESFVALLLVLFLMGCQSTLFGPVKYAYAVSPDSRTLLGASLVFVAVAGYLASRRIPRTQAVDPGLSISWNAWAETWRIVRYARERRDVFLAILGISWFWFFGSAMTLQLPAYTLVIMNGNESITTALLVAFAIGVGLGALLCERMSGHRIELGLVPFGSIGLSLFAIDLYFAQPVAAATAVSGIGEFLGRPGSLRVLADVLLLGAFGGFYSVPLYALVQQRSERRHLSRIIAANNIINAIFMVVASLLSIVVLGAGFSIPELFVILALLNAVVAVYIYSLLPEFMMRFLVWILVNTIYRLRPSGADNIPEHGPAVVVCNHVSYMDPLLLSACIRRPMRFVMYYKIFQLPLLRFLFQHAKAIPIASAREDERLMNEAFEKVDAELAAGNIVCIFPEGGITGDGEIRRFRPGIEKVLANRPVPVVPVALHNLWGSWFSRSKEGRIRRFPRRLLARVPVVIGEPVEPGDATAASLEILVRTLRGDHR